MIACPTRIFKEPSKHLDVPALELIISMRSIGSLKVVWSIAPLEEANVLHNLASTPNLLSCVNRLNRVFKRHSLISIRTIILSEDRGATLMLLVASYSFAFALHCI